MEGTRFDTLQKLNWEFGLKELLFGISARVPNLIWATVEGEMLMGNLHVSLVCIHTQAKTVLLLYILLEHIKASGLWAALFTDWKLSEHVKKLEKLPPNTLVPGLKVKVEFMKQRLGMWSHRFSFLADGNHERCYHRFISDVLSN